MYYNMHMYMYETSTWVMTSIITSRERNRVLRGSDSESIKDTFSNTTMRYQREHQVAHSTSALGRRSGRVETGIRV